MPLGALLCLTQTVFTLWMHCLEMGNAVQFIFWASSGIMGFYIASGIRVRIFWMFHIYACQHLLKIIHTLKKCFWHSSQYFLWMIHMYKGCSCYCWKCVHLHICIHLLCIIGSPNTTIKIDSIHIQVVLCFFTQPFFEPAYDI